MKPNLFKIIGLCMPVLCVASLGVVAYAADESSKNPSGWARGLKEGFEGGKPAGLAKKDVEKAQREVAKAKEKAERETKKKQLETEKAARKKQQEAEKSGKGLKKKLGL